MSDHLRSELARRIRILGLNAYQVSKEAGLNETAVRDILEERVKNPTHRTIAALAKRLGCTVADLTGDKSGAAGAKAPTPMAEEFDPNTAPPGYVWVPTLSIKPGMGGGGFEDVEVIGNPDLLPEHLIRGELRGTPSDFALMDVEGPSMQPTLESGDRVLIDRRRMNVQQPGIFVVHDGLGWVAKWVEHIPGSDPPRVRIFSENARFGPYERTLEEAHIIGRVVWFARRI